MPQSRLLGTRPPHREYLVAATGITHTHLLEQQLHHIDVARVGGKQERCPFIGLTGITQCPPVRIGSGRDQQLGRIQVAMGYGTA